MKEKNVEVGNLVSFKYKGEILNGKVLAIFDTRISIKTPDIIYSLPKNVIVDSKEEIKKVKKKEVKVVEEKPKTESVSLTGFDALKQGVLI